MILVTGGTGLLGSHLLYELVAGGHKVRAIKRAGSNLNHVEKLFSFYSPYSKDLFSKIEWADADLLDIFSIEDVLVGIEKVFHCAALVSFKQADQEKLKKINAEGTANLVNACLTKGVKKLCYVSSTAAIGKTERNEPITENTKWKVSNNNSNYSVSKFNAEREVWRGTEEGLSAVMVNPCVILGPGKWDDSSTAMFKTVHKGLSFYTEGSNAFVDVRDVAKVMIQLMESEIESERFLVTGENLNFREVFNLISDEMQKPRPKINVSKELSEFGWRYEGIRSRITNSEPRITKETSRAAHRKYIYSHEKLKSAIGFEPTPIKETIKNAIAFFKFNGDMN